MEIRWSDILKIIREVFGSTMNQKEIAQRLYVDESKISRMKSGITRGPDHSEFDWVYDRIFKPEVAGDGTPKYWKTYAVLFNKLLDAIEKCGHKEKLSLLWDEAKYPHTEEGYRNAVTQLLNQMNPNPTAQDKSHLKQKKERLANMTKKILAENEIEWNYELAEQMVCEVSDYAEYCINSTVIAIFKTVIYNLAIWNGSSQPEIPEDNLERERVVALIINAFDGIIDWDCKELTPLLHECISLKESTSLDEKCMALVSKICMHMNEDYVDSILYCLVGDDPFVNIARLFTFIEDSAIQLTAETYDSAGDNSKQK